LAIAGIAALVAGALSLSGCAAPLSLRKQQHEEEGMPAARHQAEDQVQAMQQSGIPQPIGTTSSVPSLVPGEGVPVLQGAAPAPTAAPPDKFDDKNAAHLLARCRDHVARQEWFDAAGDCRRAAEIDPKAIDPHIELMRILVSVQTYSDAEIEARTVLAERPDNAVALYYLAWTYRGRDRFSEAIATLEKAIELEPRRVEFVQALGVTYCLSDNYGKGIATFKRVIEMAPDNVTAKNALASAERTVIEKLTPYRRMAKSKPTSYEAQYALAFMCQKYGLLPQAVSTYDLALSRLPAPLPQQDSDIRNLAAQIHYNRGVVYRELGKYDLAEPSFWQSMQLDPTLTPYAQYFIGLVRYDAGKYEGAIESLRKSIELAPDVAENRSALADAYDKVGKADLAREQRKAMLAIQSRDDAAKEATRKEEKEEAEKAGPAPSAMKPEKPTAEPEKPEPTDPTEGR
jgi:tetratricopeptide (TPR) repeat protein